MRLISMHSFCYHFIIELAIKHVLVSFECDSLRKYDDLDDDVHWYSNYTKFMLCKTMEILVIKLKQLKLIQIEIYLC